MLDEGLQEFCTNYAESNKCDFCGATGHLIGLNADVGLSSVAVAHAMTIAPD